MQVIEPLKFKFKYQYCVFLNQDFNFCYIMHNKMAFLKVASQ